MSEKHYIVGAGSFGCLYDYGPNFHETLGGAIADLTGYMEGGDDGAPEDFDAEAMADAMPATGHVQYRFHSADRATFGSDYVEIVEVNGPCPQGDEG
jgi:hypothetical protein